MIRYEWRVELTDQEAGELADLLARAATYDAEPGYSTIDFGDVERSLSDPDSGDRHLVIWMLPHATTMAAPDTKECIAGVVRLAHAASGAAEATVVIEPALRSIGIMTLLLETAGLDTTGLDGWLGSGAHAISAWARGNHPAAGRLSNRFLIPRTRRVWRLIRTTQAEQAVSTAPVLEPINAAELGESGWATGRSAPGTVLALKEGGRATGIVTVDLTATKVEGFGDCATVAGVTVSPSAESTVLRRALNGAAAAAHDAGLSGLIIHLDSNDAPLVHACRLTGFQHDRTDVRYELGSDDGR